MTILSVVQGAVTSLGLRVPDRVYGATTREMVEMQSVIRRAVRVIRDGTDGKRYDWRLLQKTATITGNGTAETFDLPPDYQRMLKEAKFWCPTLPNWPMQPISSADEWLELETTAVQTVTNQWALFGGQIHVRPILTAGTTAKYIYIDKNVVRPTAGNDKAAFTADSDVFRLSEDVLELAVVWNWKKAKNQSYSAELQDYEDALSVAIAEDRGAFPAIVERGSRTRINGDLNIPYPGKITV